MAICVNCGVELDDSLQVCPLCGKNPLELTTDTAPSFNYPGDISNLERKEIRRMLWELSAVISFSAVAVCTIVDLVTEKRLTWSLFSDATIIGAWLILTLFFHAYKKPVVFIPGLVFTVIADMFLIDLITGGRKWFFDAGLPLFLSAISTILAIILLYRIAKLKGLNIFAAALVVLSGSCILTEMILDEYISGSVDLRWSLIVSVSAFPAAALLLFYHYRLKKGRFLERWLHF